MKDHLLGNPKGLQSEIIHDLLSRLPVKSLLRFRCVSNPWRSLISDPEFHKMHSNKAIVNEHVFHQRRRVMFSLSRFRIHTLDLDKLLNYPNDAFSKTVVTELDYVYRDLIKNTSVRRWAWDPWVLCCNGLLLINFYGGGLYLVNPATREFKKLPETPGHKHNCYGFGFDHSTDDYKVVNGSPLEDESDDDGILFRVYSLKTGSWRLIFDNLIFFYKILPNSYHGTLLNGGIHWFMKRVRWNDQSSFVIVSMLLAEEEVREIPLPLGYSIDSHFTVLGVFREHRLCLTRDDHLNCPRTYMEFWVMLEYGVRESWTKIRVSIPNCGPLSHSGFWRKSRDLLVLGEELFLYNFYEESFRRLSVRRITGKVWTYLETFVSLNEISNKATNSRRTRRKLKHISE